MDQKNIEEGKHVVLHADGDKIELVNRYGDAPKIQEPQQVDIDGNIEAPAEYFSLRRETDCINMDRAHLEVWQDRGMIKLYCDPYNPLGTVVVGQMHINPLLETLRINNYGQDKFSESDFILAIKQTRSLFARQKEAIDLIDSIQNIEIKVNREISKSDDERGSKKDFYEQVCHSDLPDGFDLETNIFIASADKIRTHAFFVELKYHYSGQLYFWLESPDLQTLHDEILENMMGTQIEVFHEKIPIIYK